MKKSDCHIHATLKQRLEAVHKLRHQHKIKTLCRVLKVHRSTYYKHFYSDPAPRTCENQIIRQYILQIYLDYDNSLGAYKIRRVLERDYGIQISLGRVYRLINTMNLPKRSTEKPKFKNFVKTDEVCVNHLHQQFNP
ncbi:IS3 family transposase, partial [Parvimonas sp. M20]|uniref:IS3 family transposase n=1 Tax=Parvimonas sp. M20 TaxID=3110693 RepID=UPI003FA7686D